MKLSGHRHDEAIRKLFSNSGKVFLGGTVSSLLTILSFAVVARETDLSAFGQFSVIVAYIFIIGGVFSFQTWLAVIKFGTAGYNSGSDQLLHALIKFGFLVDLSTAVLASVVSAILIWTLSPWLGLQGLESTVATASIVLLTRVWGCASAKLQMSNRFDIIALHQAAISFLRATFIIISAHFDSSLASFIFCWFLAEAIGNIGLVLFGFALFDQSERTRIFIARLSSLSKHKEEILGFLWTTNIHATMKLLIREGDVLVAGAMAGSSAAGLYRVIKQIGALAGKLSGPIYTAVYPDLASAAARCSYDDIKRIVIAAGIATGGSILVITVLFYFTGSLILERTLGNEYAQAALPATIYLLGCTLSGFSIAYQPAALSLGEAKSSLRILAFSTICYVLIFTSAARYYGLIGMSVAFVTFYLIWTLSMSHMLMVSARKIKRANVATISVTMKDA